MSLQDVRNLIITENIPKLIQSLTGFKDTDENFDICEQFVYSKIRNHKYLSVNSHEIRRKIESLAERFRIASNERCERRLLKICDDLINSPLCEEHYETDIQWSILNFLFELAYNPVNHVLSNIANETTLFVDHEAELRLAQDQKTYWTKLLETDNIQYDSGEAASDSDLSVWSDLEDDCHESSSNNADNEFDDQDGQLHAEDLHGRFSGLRPPQRKPFFHRFDNFGSEQWLRSNIQDCWWRPNDEYIHNVESVHRVANFSHEWNRSTENVSLSTTSEYCLIREIIWMFSKPTTCKYFQLSGDTISLNTSCNITLNSTSLHSLRSYLNHFCYYMTLMYQLQYFCKEINESQPFSAPPIAYEHFAEGVKQCLIPFQQHLIDIEAKLMNPDIKRTTLTILKLYANMKNHFQLLDDIYVIFKNCILDYKTNASHICTSYLICGLLNEASLSSNSNYTNLAASLFLVSIKVYLHILDVWYSEGRLEDYRHEFLIQQDSINDNMGSFKMRSVNEDDIGKQIESSLLIKLISNHSIQAGYSLNILYNMDRIGDIKNRSEFQGNFYKTFLNLVISKLNQFQHNPQDTDQSLDDDKVFNENVIENTDQTLVEFKNNLQNENLILFMVFEGALNTLCGNDSSITEKENLFNNCYELFQKLNNITKLILPFDQIVIETLTNLLESGIFVANSCVMKIYRTELDILQHIRNIRKVYLMEESDLLHIFYSNLFRQIESGENWNNPYLLTVHLNGILCSKYPATNSLFTIQINSRNYKENDVLDAIKGISVNYATNDGIVDIVNDNSFHKYNQIFRYLLKIKWGLWTLENLRFPQSMKKRKPFITLDMTDLTFKRLALARNWTIYAVQCIHNHLMTQVLQSLGERLDQKIERSKNLNEIIDVHRCYIETVYEHCFQTTHDDNFRNAIDQFLILIIALRDEWNNICCIKDKIQDHIKSEDDLDSSSTCSQVDAIEQTYITCHRVVAAILSSEVYSKNRTHLSGLSSAFNCSHPF